MIFRDHSRDQLSSADKLQEGALSHYADPAYYTQTYQNRLADVAYYVGLAQKHCKPDDEILEYGVGNGRIALPLARHGFHVTGIDHSKAMLDDFSSKLGDESKEVRDKIRLVEGDMRKMTKPPRKKKGGFAASLNTGYKLVFCTFNTALHLYSYDDVRQFFKQVKKHLREDGLFVCDLSIPMLPDLERNPEKPHSAPRFRHPHLGIVKYREYFNYDPILQLLYVTIEFEPMASKTSTVLNIKNTVKKNSHPRMQEAEPNHVHSTLLVHRQFFPQEWKAYLLQAGFDIACIHGDFLGTPLTSNSDVMIWQVKKGLEKKGHSSKEKI